MRFGIFSDIHGNLPALKAVLCDMEHSEVSHPICLGDIVGRGSHSSECLEIIRGLRCPIVQGNHDYAASEVPDDPQLNSEQRFFLGSLPLVKTVYSFTIVHSSLFKPETWSYVESIQIAKYSLSIQEKKLAFFGHIHIPHMFICNNLEVTQTLYSSFKVNPLLKYFVNPGSVGEPRDFDQRPSYVIYDDNDQIIELRRVIVKFS
jgi:predicted phosphodiesterase